MITFALKELYSGNSSNSIAKHTHTPWNKTRQDVPPNVCIILTESLSLYFCPHSLSFLFLSFPFHNTNSEQFF